jgi:hypothetical protein
MKELLATGLSQKHTPGDSSYSCRCDTMSTDQFQVVLLHVRGSLGSITLALLQQWDSTTLLRFLRYAILGGLSFIVVQQCNQQHCYTSNNTHRELLWYSEFYWHPSVCWNPLEWRRGSRVVRVQTCLCVGLWIPFGWKTEFVSGNWVREAREFIPWMVKTVDRRG